MSCRHRKGDYTAIGAGRKRGKASSSRRIGAVWRLVSGVRRIRSINGVAQRIGSSGVAYVRNRKCRWRRPRHHIDNGVLWKKAMTSINKNERRQ